MQGPATLTTIKTMIPFEVQKHQRKLCQSGKLCCKEVPQPFMQQLAMTDGVRPACASQHQPLYVSLDAK